METDNSIALKIFENFDDDVEEEILYLLTINKALKNYKWKYSLYVRKRLNIDYGAQKGYERILDDYFADNSIYNEKLF